MNESTGWSIDHDSPDKRLVSDAFLEDISAITPPRNKARTANAMCTVVANYDDIPLGAGTPPVKHDSSGESCISSFSVTPSVMQQAQMELIAARTNQAKACLEVMTLETEMAVIKVAMVSTRDSSSASNARSRSQHHIKPAPASSVGVIPVAPAFVVGVIPAAPTPSVGVILAKSPGSSVAVMPDDITGMLDSPSVSVRCQHVVAAGSSGHAAIPVDNAMIDFGVFDPLQPVVVVEPGSLSAEEFRDDLSALMGDCFPQPMAPIQEHVKLDAATLEQ